MFFDFFLAKVIHKHFRYKRQAILDIIGNRDIGCGKWLSEYVAWE